jgi:hypothetical protein
MILVGGRSNGCAHSLDQQFSDHDDPRPGAASDRDFVADTNSGGRLGSFPTHLYVARLAGAMGL